MVQMPGNKFDRLSEAGLERISGLPSHQFPGFRVITDQGVNLALFRAKANGVMDDGFFHFQEGENNFHQLTDGDSLAIAYIYGLPHGLFRFCRPDESLGRILNIGEIPHRVEGPQPDLVLR